MHKNEKGMTLVEVLVTIVIASFTMGIIYAVVMFAIDYFSVETSKTKLQQETNYIVTELQRIHRTCETYDLIITSEKVEVNNCMGAESENGKIISNSYIYHPTVETTIYPRERNLQLNNFSLTDKENKDLTVEISTVISRYLDREGIDEEEAEES